MTITLGRGSRAVTAASLKDQYTRQLAELPEKITAKPGWTSIYMGELETLRGRADALADIEKYFDEVEVWAVNQHYTLAQLLVHKFDVIAELAIDVAAGDSGQSHYDRGRYTTIRDIWNQLRNDPSFPGNDKNKEN